MCVLCKEIMYYFYVCKSSGHWNYFMKYFFIGILLFGLMDSKAESWSELTNSKVVEDDSAIVYHRRGIHLYKQGDFENSVRSFYQSVKRKRQMNYEETSIANTLMNIGVLYRKMWDYEKAIEYLNEALTIFENNNDTNKIAIVLLNKGNIYADLGDNQKALEQYKQSSNFIEKTNYASIIYNNIGSNYMEISDYEKALESFKKSIALLDSGMNWKANELVMKNIANVYVLLDSVRKANSFYQKGLDYYTENNDHNSLKKGYFYFDYGKFLVEHGDESKGFSYIHEGGRMLKNIYGMKHPDVAEYFMDIGQIYIDNHKYDQALDYLQRALIALVPDFNAESLHENPERTYQSADIVLLGIFKRKAKAIFQKSYENPDINLLKSAYQSAMTGIYILEDLKKGYVSERSKMLLMEHEKEIYPTAILTALKLHELTSYENYKEEAFLIAERSKASTLLESIKTMNAREFGGIPEHLIQREFSLKRNIALYDEKLYEESKINDPDSNKIKFWENKLYGLKNQYYNLIDTFEKDYPGYYELKYKPETISIRDIRDILKPKEALIEYCVSNSNIISFVLTRKKFEFYVDTLDRKTKTKLVKFIRNLHQNRFSESENQNIESFISEAGCFYQKLIAPHEQLIQSRSLIIIPDGQLAYLPFEVLVTEHVNNKAKSNKYNAISYLVKRNAISYAHSSTLLFKAKASHEDQHKELLAFAPKYDYPDRLPKNIPLFRQKYLNQLYPLPGSKEEVNLVQKIIGGRVFMDDDATEANFKKNAAKFDILHLAMHTIINIEDPMFTKMIFTQTNDSEEDNFLNTYELYNMKLSARMAVLSSCNTGSGKLQKGEGVISLARGFMYAGCPSVTMSLWEVEDKSGTRLMKYYYEYLKKGKSKSDALRKAKLKFLENADPLKSHPYFWSGYVVIGNHDSLFQNRTRTYLLIFALVLSVVAGITYIKTRTSKNDECLRIK